MSRQYFCDDDVQAIRASIADGSVVPWRKDVDGRQWFRRIEGNADIRGIPKPEVTAADAFATDTADDEQIDDDDQVEPRTAGEILQAANQRLQLRELFGVENFADDDLVD